MVGWLVGWLVGLLLVWLVLFLRVWFDCLIVWQLTTAFLVDPGMDYETLILVKM